MKAEIHLPDLEAQVAGHTADIASLQGSVSDLIARVAKLEAKPEPDPTPEPIPTGKLFRIPTAPPHSDNRPKWFPIPFYDPNSFIKRPVNPRVIVVRGKSGEDLSPLVQAAQNEIGNITVKIEGGGSFKNQVHLKHHTVFDSCEYFCDTVGSYENTGTNNSIWYGTFLLDDYVLVEGTWRPPETLHQFFINPSFESLKKVQAITDEEMAGTGTTIWESPFHTESEPGREAQPSVTVFQAYQDAISQQHERESRGLVIFGIHIKGRQTVSDGGTRQTLAFGNCIGGAAIYNYLEKTASIGITFGGSGLQGGHARDFLVWCNVTTGLAAANIAVVNGRDGIIAQNYAHKFGRKGFGGGVAGFDLETNDVSEWAKNIWVTGNLYDYEGSYMESAGNAINLQDPGFDATKNGDCYAVNNWIIGGRNDALHRFMANGMFVSTLNRVTLQSNYIYKTGQTAIQWYGLRKKLTAQEFNSLPEWTQSSYKQYKVYLPDGDNWTLHPDRQATGQGSVIKDNWLDSTGGGGNPTMIFTGCSGIEVGPNKLIVPKDVKFGTDPRLLDCKGEGNTAHGNILNDSIEIFLTSEGCN